jgi:hypothetical protein
MPRHTPSTKGLRARMSLDEFVHALGDAEEDVLPPGTFGHTINPMTSGELAKAVEGLGTPLPSDINPQSFRCWMCIEFIPDVVDPTDLDACYDFWCLIVSADGEDGIAYFEIADSD